MTEKKNNRFNLYKSKTKDLGGVAARVAADQEKAEANKSNDINLFGSTTAPENLSNMMRVEFTIYDKDDQKGYTAQMTVDRTTNPDIEQMVSTYLTIMGKDPKDYNLA